MSAMPIGACSNALRNRSWASRSSASARRRSVRSRALMTMPSTEGSSSRLVATASTTRQLPSAWRRRTSTRSALLALATSDSKPLPRGLAVLGVDEVEHVGADERLDVEPEDPLGDRAGVHEPARRVDDRHDVVGVADHRPEAGLVALEQRRHLVDGAGRPPAHDHACETTASTTITSSRPLARTPSALTSFLSVFGRPRP